MLATSPRSVHCLVQCPGRRAAKSESKDPRGVDRSKRAGAARRMVVLVWRTDPRGRATRNPGKAQRKPGRADARGSRRSGTQKPGADRQAPASRAWRAVPSHGRCPHAAALALHRRCACDIAPHPPGNPPESARCLRAPCVRCVHARRRVRSGEARRLCVLRACVSLSIRVVRLGAGDANEAQGPTTHITTNTTPRGADARARGGPLRTNEFTSPEQARLA